MIDLRAVGRTFVTLTLLSACARGDNAARDTAAAAGSTSSAAATPAGGGQTAARPAPQDADQEFLRGMIDHHEGLIQMAMAAMSKASRSATQGDAHNLHTRQADEQKKMIADVRAQYGETVTPMVMPQHRAMADSLTARTGAEYDRTFYRLVVEHHREGVRMIDAILPRLTKADVRSMAEKMKADQQREIAEFERKAGA